MRNQKLPLHLVCLSAIQHNLFCNETFFKDSQTNRVHNYLYNVVERTCYPSTPGAWIFNPCCFGMNGALFIWYSYIMEIRGNVWVVPQQQTLSQEKTWRQGLRHGFTGGSNTQGVEEQPTGQSTCYRDLRAASFYIIATWPTALLTLLPLLALPVFPRISSLAIQAFFFTREMLLVGHPQSPWPWILSKHFPAHSVCQQYGGRIGSLHSP